MYRRARRADDDGVISVLLAAFGAWPKHSIDVDPEDHIRWKASRLPGSRVAHVVAELEGRVVGTILFGVRPAFVRGTTRDLRYSYDAAVHPSFHGRGVMRQMRELALEFIGPSFDLHIGYSRHPAITQLRREAHGKPIGSKLFIFTRQTTDASVLTQHDGSLVHHIGSFDERVNVLWDAAKRPFDLATARTASHLNWRYCDRRAGDFTSIVYEKNGHVLGYAVLRRQREIGHIVDLLVLPGRLDVLSELLAFASKYFQHQGATSVECWATRHHPYRHALERQGFTPKRRAVRPLYEPGRLDLVQLSYLEDAKAQIHLMAGDTDLL